MSQAPPHPALDRLGALVGEWELRVTTGGLTIGPERTSFRWLDGTWLLRQHTVVETDRAELPAQWAEQAPSTVTLVIGFDDAAERFEALYADSRGVHRIYQMSLDEGVWRQWREAPEFHQRFSGMFSEDGRTITAQWEYSEDGHTWRHDFELTYTRID